MISVIRVASALALVLGLLLGLSPPTVMAQGPLGQDNPLSASVVGDALAPIPPQAAQWIRFDYSFTSGQAPRPTVTVRLLNGVQNGLRFEIWSPERLVGTWVKNNPVGRGSQVVFPGCSQVLPDDSSLRCTKNDLVWVGGFGAQGIYYVRVVNTGTMPVAPQLILSGPGLGQCVNPTGASSPMSMQGLATSEGFALAQCQLASASAVPSSQTPVAATLAATPTLAATATLAATLTPAATATLAATLAPAATATLAATQTPIATATSVATQAPAAVATPVATQIPAATATTAATQAPTKAATTPATQAPAATVTPAATQVPTKAATAAATQAATLPPTIVATQVPTKAPTAAATATTVATQAPTKAATTAAATQAPAATATAVATQVPTKAATTAAATQAPAATATTVATQAPTKAATTAVATQAPAATATTAATQAPATKAATAAATQAPAATATKAATVAPTAAPTPTPTRVPTAPAAGGTTATKLASAQNHVAVDVTINSAGEMTVGGFSLKALGVTGLDSQVIQAVKNLDNAHVVVQGEVVTVDVSGTPVLKLDWSPASRQTIANLAAQYGYVIGPDTLERIEEWIVSLNLDVTARYTNDVSKPLTVNLTKAIWIDVGPQGQVAVEKGPLAYGIDPSVLQTLKQSGVLGVTLCWDKGTLTTKLDGKDLPSITLYPKGVQTLGKALGLGIESGVDPVFGSQIGVDVILPGGKHQTVPVCGN